MYWYDKKVLPYLWVPWTNLFVRAKDVDMNQQRRGTVQCFSGCGNVPFSIPCIGQKRGTDKQVCPWHPSWVMTESIAQFVTCYLFGPQDPKPWYLSGLTEQATTSGGGNLTVFLPLNPLFQHSIIPVHCRVQENWEAVSYRWQLSYRCPHTGSSIFVRIPISFQFTFGKQIRNWYSLSGSSSRGIL